MPFLLAFALVWMITVVTRRFFLHPLRGVPGPFLSAITGYYKAYFDIVQDGGFFDELKRLHEIYGPIVRVGPNELHFSDPHAYGQIYAPGSRFTKDPSLYQAFHLEQSSFGFLDPRESKERRTALLPLFSRSAILKLEGVIQSKVDQLISRVTECGIADLSFAFRCTTADIIDEYLFAESENSLSASDFDHSAVAVLKDSNSFLWKYQHFPWLFDVFARLPESILAYLNPGFVNVQNRRRCALEKIDRYIADPDAVPHKDHDTFYRRVLSMKTVPSRMSLLDEAQNLHFAGSDTVGNTCAHAFHVLEDRRVHEKLLGALKEVWPDVNVPVGLEELEKVPYLTAVIKEALRVSIGIVSPLSRVVGEEGAEIMGVQVPAGTTVGISAYFVHMSSEIFPDPGRFYPERWMEVDSAKLDPFLVPFSKGPRACIGLNLAWAELYLILGNLFRRLDIELYETTREEMKFKAFFGPFLSEKHVRARVAACTE